MRTLITREDPEPLRSSLEKLGISCIHIPLVTLHPTHERHPSVKPDWVLVTSAAVARFVPDLTQYIGQASVVAVGQQTAESLVKLGANVADVGQAGGVDALNRVPEDRLKRCWYVGAKVPSAGLGNALNDRGVLRWSVYENRMPDFVPEALAEAAFDSVSFASGSAVQAFVCAVGLPAVPVAVLGPATADVAHSLGVRVDRVARQRTLASLAKAVAELPCHSVRK